MNSRINSLDVLRGLAALSVFFYHITYGFDYGMDTISSDRIYFPYGKYGVHLFFIISGFVIFMTIEKLNSIQKFAINRITRLYPTYWVCLIITILLTSFLKDNYSQFSIKQILINLTMFQKWLKVPSIDGVYWSLGVELIFYLYISFFFYFKLNKKIITIGIIFLSVSVLFLFLNFPYSKGIRNLFILNYWPLFFSGILFYQLRNNSLRKVKAITLLILCFIIEVFYMKEGTNDGLLKIFFTLLIIYSCFIFFLFSNIKILEKTRIFAFFGIISYPLYLLHQEISYSFLRKLRTINQSQFVEIIILFFITLILSISVHLIIEKKLSVLIREKLTILFNQNGVKKVK